MGKNIIGLDIGGTKITGIVYKDGRIIDSLTIVTPNSLRQFEKSLLKLVDFLSAKGKVAAIGIGMAGLVDSKKGIVVYSPNIKFVKNLNLVRFFSLNSFNKVRINNDAKCFVLAESLLGAGKDKQTIVGVTLGTGIGGGLCARGQIYNGANFGAGEVGQMIYEGTETFEQAFKKARDQKNNKKLAEITGALLTNIYRTIDPQAVVVGGGVALDKHRNFLGQAKKICAKNLASYKLYPNIQISKLKNAGALGAALLWK